MTTATHTHAPGRSARIMASYAALPTWVKLWMNVVLGPVNLATLAFLDEPGGALIAALAIGGMALTVAIVVASGGFTKLAAAGLILPWTPQVLMLVFASPGGSALYQTFLTVLLVINLVSLAFDVNDVRQWFRARA
ncbi:MAG: hypothetical protein AAGA11_11415 [Pseudomonadota bacterium]